MAPTAGQEAKKKVTAFVGAPRKRHTHEAVHRFLQQLEDLGDVETEIVLLNDYRMDTCRGCKQCFSKGEQFCPLDDDRDLLIEKMIASDGVVFASPNYSFQVSAVMKTFLDRLGYVFHRPCFHQKAFTSIVVQGTYGGTKIVKYLDFVGKGLGFCVAKGSCSTALEPMTPNEQRRRDEALAKQAARFHDQIWNAPEHRPDLFEVMVFRMARTSINLELDESSRDYRYYRESGWFESDYYYPTKLGLLKRMAGRGFDAWAVRQSRARAA